MSIYRGTPIIGRRLRQKSQVRKTNKLYYLRTYRGMPLNSK